MEVFNFEQCNFEQTELQISLKLTGKSSWETVFVRVCVPLSVNLGRLYLQYAPLITLPGGAGPPVFERFQ